LIGLYHEYFKLVAENEKGFKEAKMKESVYLNNEREKMLETERENSPTTNRNREQ
jgi:hypothetical protein